METITTQDAAEEQLALGNKMTYLKQTIIIDLKRKTKSVEFVAHFDKLILPESVEDDAIYAEDAREWFAKYLGTYTTIRVIGCQGQVATLPYEQKDRYLPKIIQVFNT